jgi:hypothetical protein
MVSSVSLSLKLHRPMAYREGQELPMGFRVDESGGLGWAVVGVVRRGGGGGGVAQVTAVHMRENLPF